MLFWRRYVEEEADEGMWLQFLFLSLPNFTFTQPVFAQAQKCTQNNMKPPPGVWMKQLKTLCCSAGEQEVAEEEAEEAGEGNLLFFLNIYMMIYD